MAKAISTKTTVFVCMGVLLTIGTMLVATSSAYAESTCIGACKNHHNDVEYSPDNSVHEDNDVNTNINEDNDVDSHNTVCTAAPGPGGTGTPGGGTGGSGGGNCNL